MITTENYITYFMLYVDNELTIEEQEMVMQFANGNSMYEESLALLMQAKLQIPTPNVISKTNLLKPNVVAVDDINEENYDSYFTASVDDELTKQEEENLTDFLYQNPALETEYDWIEKTKLPNEDVVYNSKNSLLRKEEKRRWVYYVQVSSAAALLVIGLLFWFNKPKGGDAVKSIATNIPKVQPSIVQAQQQNIPTNNEPIKDNYVNDKTQLVIEAVDKNVNRTNNNHNVVATPNTVSGKPMQTLPKVNPMPSNDNIENYASNNIKRIYDNDILQPVTIALAEADIKRISYAGTAEINFGSNTNEATQVVTDAQQSSKNKLKNRLFSKAKNLIAKLKAEGDEKINIGPAFVNL
jgi:hypothetical protein